MALNQRDDPQRPTTDMIPFTLSPDSVFPPSRSVPGSPSYHDHIEPHDLCRVFSFEYCFPSVDSEANSEAYSEHSGNESPGLDTIDMLFGEHNRLPLRLEGTSVKIVLKLDLHDNVAKKKAMKTVSFLSGVESISLDAKEMKLTVVGMVDPARIVKELRKYYFTDIISVGPAKEPEWERGGPAVGVEENHRFQPEKTVLTVLKLYDNGAKKKAMKRVSVLSGVESISLDAKEMKLTVVGMVDPVRIVTKLRKYHLTDIISVGPCKRAGEGEGGSSR